jgi:hypothetical protein
MGMDALIKPGRTDSPCPSPVHERKPYPSREERVDWSVLKTLEVGAGIEIPEGVDLNRAASSISRIGKRLGRRFSRKGRRVWRLE